MTRTRAKSNSPRANACFVAGSRVSRDVPMSTKQDAMPLLRVNATPTSATTNSPVSEHAYPNRSSPDRRRRSSSATAANFRWADIASARA